MVGLRLWIQLLIASLWAVAVAGMTVPEIPVKVPSSGLAFVGQVTRIHGVHVHGEFRTSSLADMHAGTRILVVPGSSHHRSSFLGNRPGILNWGDRRQRLRNAAQQRRPAGLLMSSDGKPTADEEGRRLFVSKLSGATDADRLREAFAPFGTLLDAQIAKPGLGHVTFEDVECASRALDRMQGVIVDGYEIGVRRPRSYFIRAEQQVKMGLVQKQRQKEAKQSNDVREQARNLDASEGLGNGSDGVDDDVDVRLQRQREALKSQRNAGAASPFGVEEGARGARAREAEAAPRYLTDGARRRVIRYDEEEDDDEDDEDDDVWADFDRTFDEDDDWKDDGATAKDMERQAGSKWQDFKGKDKDFGWEDDESDLIVPDFMKDGSKAPPPPAAGAGPSSQGSNPKGGGAPGADASKSLLQNFMEMSDEEFDSKFSPKPQSESPGTPSAPPGDSLRGGVGDSAKAKKAPGNGVSGSVAGGLAGVGGLGEMSLPVESGLARGQSSPLDGVLSMSDEEFFKNFMAQDSDPIEGLADLMPKFGGAESDPLFDDEVEEEGKEVPDLSRPQESFTKTAPVDKKGGIEKGQVEPRAKGPDAPVAGNSGKNDIAKAAKLKKDMQGVQTRRQRGTEGVEVVKLGSEQKAKAKNDGQAEITSIEELLEDGATPVSDDLDVVPNKPLPGMSKDLLKAMDISLAATIEAEKEAELSLDDDDDDDEEAVVGEQEVRLGEAELKDARKLVEEQKAKERAAEEGGQSGEAMYVLSEEKKQERELLEKAAEMMLQGDEDGAKVEMESLGSTKQQRKLLGNLKDEPRAKKLFKDADAVPVPDVIDDETAYFDSVLTGWIPRGEEGEDADHGDYLDLIDEIGLAEDAPSASTQEGQDAPNVASARAEDAGAEKPEVEPASQEQVAETPQDAAISATVDQGSLSRESVVSSELLGTLANISSINSMQRVASVSGMSDMTYNALLQLLQGRIDMRLNGLMTKIDEQAMAARKDMILSQLTPEQITLNALLDVFENRSRPMQDVHARMGPRMKEVRLHHGLSRNWWKVHERVRSDHRFRMSFVPSSVKKSWDSRKEVIRTGALDVDSYLLNAEGSGEEEVDEEEIKRKAAESWAKLKAESRKQSGKGATPSARASMPKKGGAKRQASAAAAVSKSSVSGRSSPSVPSMSTTTRKSVTVSRRPASQSASSASAAVQPDVDQDQSPSAHSGLPVDDATSLAGLREFIKKDKLDIKTGGKSKAAVLKMIQQVWLENRT